MSRLNRRQPGLLFNTDFRTGAPLDTQVWSLSPSDPSRFSLTSNPGRLTVYPDNVYGETAFMLMAMPVLDQFVFEIRNTFTPSSSGDVAGIVAYTTDETKIALLQYYDQVSGSISYTHQRIQFKDGIYTGWGSSDGGATWHLLGSDVDAYAMIGIMLTAPTLPQATPQSTPQATPQATPTATPTATPAATPAATPTATPTATPQATPQATPRATPLTSPMLIDYIRIFGDNGITVANLLPGQTVSMISGGQVLLSATCAVNSERVFLDMTNLPSPVTGYLQLNSGASVLEVSNAMDMYPGDQFWYGIQMHVLRGTQELTQDIVNQLGMLSEGQLRVKLMAYNPDTIPYMNMKVTVIAGQGLHREALRGYEWAMLAADLNGNAGPFSTTINIGTVYPGQSVPFWLDIQRPPNPITRFEGSDLNFTLSFVEGGT